MAQRSDGEGLPQPIDRRAFLSAAGASGLALAVPGCASGKPRVRAVAAVPSRLEQAMRGHVFEKGQPGFSGARLLYNERFDYVMPRAVARPIGAGDVQGAVRWAVAHGVPLRARSGGHSYEGYSTVPGGVMLDLRKLNGISVNHRAKTATIGAGAQLIDVYAGCSQISLAACHTVGTSPGGTLSRESFQAKSDYVTRPLSSHARQTLITAAERRASESGSGALLFDCYGGAINRVASSATAFVHRNALFCIQYLSYNGGSAWLSQTHSAMRPFVSGQAYQNYIDRTLPNWQRAYYGGNYARLESIRHTYDPHHFFNFPQAVGR